MQSGINKKQRYTRFIEYFSTNMPNAKTELKYNNPFELLVAVILSAQCTDKRVNETTPALFQRFPTAAGMAVADDSEIFEYIKSISYPNNKAKHLSAMSKKLQSDFHGIVPDNREELMQLPGVGRKTANVILSVVFNKAAMAVDTHVFRVSHRIGLVPLKATTPLSVEQELTKNIPEEIMPDAHHWLILHGRYVCKAIKPLCQQCGISDICKDYLKKHQSSND